MMAQPKIRNKACKSWKNLESDIDIDMIEALALLWLMNKQLTIFQCIRLFYEYFSNAFLALIDIIIANCFHNQLLQLGELTSATCRYLLSHLFIIVLQLSNLLQVPHVHIHLLLVLLFKSLPKKQNK